MVPHELLVAIGKSDEGQSYSFSGSIGSSTAKKPFRNHGVKWL